MVRSRARLLSPQFVLVTVAGSLYFLSLGCGLPIVPRYVKGPLGGDDLAVGIAVGAFAVGAVLLRPYSGRLGDRIGRRVLVIGGALVVALATALYLVADRLPLFAAVRFFGGLGEAAFFVGAATMITDLAPADRRGEAISYWSIAVYSGLAFGPALGETVYDASGFDAVWITGAALALGAALLALGTRETKRPDLVPSGDLPLLHRAALAPGMILFLGLIGLAGFSAFVPLYVRDVGWANSRNVFLLYGVLILLIRIAGARLPDRLGPLRAGTLALGGGAAGLLVMAAWGSVAGLLVGTVLFAVGMAFMYPSLMTLALVGVDDTQRAAVVGTFSTFFDLSQGVGALVVGTIAQLSGYRGAFAGSALIALGGLVLLRSGLDPRVRERHAAVRAFDEIPEPEPGT